MKLYRVDTPQPCDIEECGNNAVLVVRTDEGIEHAVCPTHVLSMSVMNSDNAEFFAREPLLGQVSLPDLHVTLPRFFASVETFLTSTYYTVMKEPLKRHWPFYCLISLPAARWRGRGPSMYGYFVHPGEASQEVRACYGLDIEYLPIEQFRQLHP